MLSGQNSSFQLLCFISTDTSTSAAAVQVCSIYTGYGAANISAKARSQCEAVDILRSPPIIFSDEIGSSTVRFTTENTRRLDFVVRLT